jgi:zinc-ribbon domain
LGACATLVGNLEGSGMIVRDNDDEDWDDDPDEESTVPCPHCREPVYDDTELCPNCGQYLSIEDSPHRKPWWVVLGVVVCLMMVFWWIFHL